MDIHLGDALGRRGLHPFHLAARAEEAETLAIASPFDFGRRRCSICRHACPIRPRRSTPAVIDVAVPLIEASAGGSFVLFTTTVRCSARAPLRARWATLSTSPLVQGEAPREQLLRVFRESGNAGAARHGQLLGGRGRQGRCIAAGDHRKAAVRLADDALTRAHRAPESGGGNPFREYQLPEAHWRSSRASAA
jgi:ATP-dependent DNA helicase DinG